MRRSKFKRVLRSFKRHRHVVRKSMRGLTSVPIRYRGRRL